MFDKLNENAYLQKLSPPEKKGEKLKQFRASFYALLDFL
jgi:hypothetical protein